MSFSADPHAVIPWVTDAVRKVLEAASKTETIQRVVLTSSSRAAYMSSRGSTKGVRIDESKYLTPGQRCRLIPFQILGTRNQSKQHGIQRPRRTPKPLLCILHLKQKVRRPHGHG